MTFVPFMIAKTKCILVFSDPNVGEFQYDLHGIVDEPDIQMEPIRIPQSFYTNKNYTVDLNIPVEN